VADSAVSASYTFSVTPVVISSTSGVTTSFVLTAYQSSAKTATGLIKLGTANSTSYNKPWYIVGSGTTLACLMLIALPRRRRLGALLAVVLSVAALSAAGCGSGGSSSSSGTPATITNATPGTYYVTVTGVASTSTGNVVHSSTVTFNVTQ
jgi:hypothetical protein